MQVLEQKIFERLDKIEKDIISKIKKIDKENFLVKDLIEVSNYSKATIEKTLNLLYVANIIDASYTLHKAKYRDYIKKKYIINNFTKEIFKEIEEE